MSSISEKESKEYLQYRVGGLLYSPASNEKIAEKILSGSVDKLMSVALCLEDSIAEDACEEAENTMINTLEKLSVKPRRELPLLFVRVRNPEHITHIHEKIGKLSELLTGFILPKFDCSNSYEYIEHFLRVKSEHKLYIMPIIETQIIAHVETRIETLVKLKKQLDEIADKVLNIRVGGNDFSNIFGLRRSVNQNIYQMSPVANILHDIYNIFGRSYVVSAPVWEYFKCKEGMDWKAGLENELELDKLNGFIGKTAIHPSQLPSIWDSLMVSKSDYDDALGILNWKSETLGVAKSESGERMNEVKVHANWARKTLALAEIYGVKK